MGQQRQDARFRSVCVGDNVAVAQNRINQPVRQAVAVISRRFLNRARQLGPRHDGQQLRLIFQRLPKIGIVGTMVQKVGA